MLLTLRVTFYVVSIEKQAIPFLFSNYKSSWYYAQAWSLVFRKQPLFNRGIEAWVSGPIVRDVWDEYKAYKYSDIPAPDNLEAEFDEDEIEVLEEVWNAYGELSAKHLAELTQSETPWLNARKGLEPAEISTKIISREDMKSCYAPLVEA